MSMLENLIDKYSLKGNWVDLVFIILLLYFIITNRGFIDAFLDVMGLVIALVASYKLYGIVAKLFMANFALSKGIANVVGFFLVWMIVGTAYAVFIRLFHHVFEKIRSHQLNVYLGYMMAIVQALFFFLIVVSLIFAFPVRGQIKNDILQSKSGPFFVNLSQSVERKLKNVFGEAIIETLNFLTIKPDSNQTLNLNFKLQKSQLSTDFQSEQIMTSLVNQERIKVGRDALTIDIKLQEAARDYAAEMLMNGFFSHNSAVDSSTPADRTTRAHVVYTVIGENLAYAPDVYLAHQGLMNSEGHRKNILSPDYGRVGIAVIDANVYGKMFVQEFAD